MALSDYERRVLDDFETEFRTTTAARPWFRIRSCVLVIGYLIVITCPTILCAFLLPAAASAAVCTVTGLLGGYLVAINRHRFRWSRDGSLG